MSKYTLNQIADELDATALGESYYGNALYVARDFSFLTYDDKCVLTAWMDGSNKNLDLCVELQAIAIKIRINSKETSNE